LTILVAEKHDATRGFVADNLTAHGLPDLIAPDRSVALSGNAYAPTGCRASRRRRATGDNQVSV
jgi:hypothetical protein